MALLEDIGGYIDTNTSLTLGTDLFLGLLPETPSNCVSIFENSGVAPLFTQGSAGLPVLEKPQLQFIVRDASYSNGRSVAETLYRLLTQVFNQTINSNLYLRIEAISVPSVMDRDQTKRVLFTCNFDVVRVTP